MNRRRLALAAAALVVVPIGWWWFAGRRLPVPPNLEAGVDRGDAELARLRLTGRFELFDEHLERLRRADPDVPRPTALRRIAETLLERVQLRSQQKGLRVGAPVWDVPPPAVGADVTAGLASLRAARELGDQHSESFRIEAGLLAQQIDGLVSALRLNGQVDAALQKAVELDPHNARAQVALGCRALFAPRFLGHDPRAALTYLSRAAEALQLDERPLVFAAFAHHLLGEAERAQRSLEQAIGRNPNNAYAREVLRRLRAGEAGAFERDLQ